MGKWAISKNYVMAGMFLRNLSYAFAWYLKTLRLNGYSAWLKASTVPIYHGMLHLCPSLIKKKDLFPKWLHLALISKNFKDWVDDVLSLCWQASFLVNRLKEILEIWIQIKLWDQKFINVFGCQKSGFQCTWSQIYYRKWHYLLIIPFNI